MSDFDEEQFGGIFIDQKVNVGKNAEGTDEGFVSDHFVGMAIPGFARKVLEKYGAPCLWLSLRDTPL